MNAKPMTQPASQTLEDLYNRITGDEDARVCKDIPEEACNDQPHNFFAYLGANLLGKVGDEIASAKGAAYVAVSNALIGVLMLAGGLIGLIGDLLGTAATLLVLGLLSLMSVAYILTLPEATS